MFCYVIILVFELVQIPAFVRNPKLMEKSIGFVSILISGPAILIDSFVKTHSAGLPESGLFVTWLQSAAPVPVIPFPIIPFCFLTTKGNRNNDNVSITLFASTSPLESNILLAPASRAVFL